jgi:hypothetical protein
VSLTIAWIPGWAAAVEYSSSSSSSLPGVAIAEPGGSNPAGLNLALIGKKVDSHTRRFNPFQVAYPSL